MKTFESGQAYHVRYECRDIGYGVEDGEEILTYGDVEPYGKLGFTRINGESIYLFEDEIISAEKTKRPPIQNVVRVEFVLNGDFTGRETNRILDEWLRSAEDDDRLGGYSIVSEYARVAS